ncbi:MULTISPECIES: DMT family transporter [unclassified Adlercreutzia]|uniref:DMT family transporter n=1 Tax=unclassified Adlercreutzia TaxID=2636013 RepID=UPI0019815596|nr:MULTISPECIES: DMT family transporter [unclassified Adlercreutzia]
MSRMQPLPPFVYKLMCAAAALIWGSSFVVMKDTIDAFPPSWLIGVRFLLTALLLTLVFAKRMRHALNAESLRAGSILGALIFAAYWAQTVGLNFTTPGKNAFLTDIYCVLVPFMFWFVTRKRPTRYNLAAAALCITGVGFVSLSGDTLSVGFGDFMTIIGGFFFGAHIVATAVLAKNRDAIVLTVYQFWVSGALGIVVGAATEPMPNFAAIPPAYFANMAYLIVACTCVAMVFQNTALKYIHPSQASLLLSLESVFGVAFSVALYGETLTVPLVIGFVLIFCAIVLSEAFPLKKPSRKTNVSISENPNCLERSK